MDFSAHISYHFMQHRNMSIDGRVRDSLFALGLPILQGAISTCLGVLGLALAPSYIFLTFFKMVSLVVILGAIHGIILLPVLLSIFGPGACTKQQPSKPEEKPAFQTDDECTKECNHKFYSHTLSQMDTQKQIKIPRPKSSVSTVTPTVHQDHDGSQQLSYVSQLTAETAAEQLNSTSLTATTNTSPSNSQGT